MILWSHAFICLDLRSARMLSRYGMVVPSSKSTSFVHSTTKAANIVHTFVVHCTCCTSTSYSEAISVRLPSVRSFASLRSLRCLSCFKRANQTNCKPTNEQRSDGLLNRCLSSVCLSHCVFRNRSIVCKSNNGDGDGDGHGCRLRPGLCGTRGRRCDGGWEWL